MRRLLAILALCLPAIAGAQTANLWIDTNGGTCTRQSTPATYSDAAACSSMDVAINACTAGDTIRMKAGTYGSQTINRTKTTPGCAVIAETTTTIGALTTDGAWYEVQNINSSSWSITIVGANNIICRDCNFVSADSYVVTWSPDTSAVGDGVAFSDISWIGGSMSGTRATNNEACSFCIWVSSDNGGSGDTADTLLIEGVTFSDNIDTAAGAPDFNHYEVIRVDGNVDGITFRGNTFVDNETSTAQVFFSTARGIKPRNIVFENNFFGSDPVAFTAIQMNFQNQDNCSDWTFDYNTFRKTPIIDASSGSCDTGFSNVVWTGNLMTRGDCQGNTFNYNLGYGSSGSACSGTGNTVDTEASVNFDTDGFHILTGSSAIDAGGSGASCIATDIDGNSRSDPCDVGAHEFGAGGGGSPPAAPANFRLTKLWQPILGE